MSGLNRGKTPSTQHFAAEKSQRAEQKSPTLAIDPRECLQYARLIEIFLLRITKNVGIQRENAPNWQ
jgi:hypothetical protein